MDGRRTPIVGMLLAGLLAGPVAAKGTPPPKKLAPPSPPAHDDLTKKIAKSHDRLPGFSPKVSGLSPFGTGPHHAGSGPMVKRLVVTSKPVKGKPANLKIAANAVTGVTGASFDFGEPGGRYGESQCKLDHKVHGRGRKAARDHSAETQTFSVPYAFTTTGPHKVRFELTSGACDRTTQVSAGEITVDVLAPPTVALRAVTGPLAGVLSTNCPNADVMPTHETRTAARIATACLINEVRRIAGRRQLRTLRVLRRIAAAHSRDMVERRYFDHSEPGGPSLATRMHSIGWKGSAGENIGYGTAWYATPRSMMWGWMHSSGHRHNILDRSWRYIGVAIALGAPTSTEMAAATYTTDFGGN
jgi:uncharacterized protein YkwD